MNKTGVRIIDGYEHIVYDPITFSEEEMLKRSLDLYSLASKRRSVRHFADQEVPREVLLNLIRTAGTSPSGANKQPWTFCLVADKGLKHKIRIAAEEEEYHSYHERMGQEWLDDLKPLGTDWRKPFLETAPWLIVVFRKIYDISQGGRKKNNYYVTESVGLACGMLLLAIQNAGLSALTHTPSPMNFLTNILDRPENEKPFLLIPIGYAAEDTYVPHIHRKDLDEICVMYK